MRLTEDALDALPYDPREEDQDEPSEPTKPLRPVLRVLRWAIGAFIVGQAANAAVGVASVIMLTPQQDGSMPAWNSDAFAPVETAVSVLFIATLVVAAACYFRFIYRAMDNLKKYSSRHIQGTPLGSVVWHFVPGVGWIKPYSIMRLLWVRSHNPVNRNAEPSPPGSLGGWWLLWLGVNLAAGYSALLQQSLNPYPDAASMIGTTEYADAGILRMMYIANIVSSLCAVASSLLLLPIVKEITDAQDIIEKADAFKD
jgi:hypothetical protein